MCLTRWAENRLATRFLHTRSLISRIRAPPSRPNCPRCPTSKYRHCGIRVSKQELGGTHSARCEGRDLAPRRPAFLEDSPGHWETVPRTPSWASASPFDLRDPARATLTPWWTLLSSQQTCPGLCETRPSPDPLRLAPFLAALAFFSLVPSPSLRLLLPTAPPPPPGVPAECPSGRAGGHFPPDAPSEASSLRLLSDQSSRAEGGIWARRGPGQGPSGL